MRTSSFIVDSKYIDHVEMVMYLKPFDPMSNYSVKRYCMSIFSFVNE